MRMDTDEVGRRVRELMATRGLTQRALAEAAGVSKNRVNELANGRIGDKVALTTVDRIAEQLGVPIHVLLGGSRSGFEADVLDRLDSIQQRLAHRQLELLPTPDMPHVHLYGKAAAGLGEHNEPLTEEPLELIPVSAAVAALPGRTIALRVTGDSMAPCLREGDIVVAWYGEQHLIRERMLPGDVMVITDGSNDEYVKSVYWDDEAEQLTLCSLNQAYPEKRMAYDSIRWTGLVVAWSKG